MRHHARIMLRGLPRLQIAALTNKRSPGRSLLWFKLPSIACLAVLALQAIVGMAIAQSARTPTPEPTLAPLRNERAPDRIPDQYIVVFKPGTSRRAILAAQDRVKELGGSIRHIYKSAPIGFSAEVPENALPALRAIPGVAYIEPNRKMRTFFVQPLDAEPIHFPPTGLDRTSERLLPLDNRYTYSETGEGVHVYVIDSGIRRTHTEFGGRVLSAVNFLTENGAVDPTATDDCAGHGTHVAGIIGGANFGIAKQVTLHSVRFLNCQAETPNLDDGLAAVLWVNEDAINHRPAVINFSAGTDFVDVGAFEEAVLASIASGITFVAAAGNGNTNACTVSPAALPEVITVGATWSDTDTRWTYYPPPGSIDEEQGSNFGPCVDLFAPGVDIVSAWPDGLLGGGCTVLPGHYPAPPDTQTAKCFGTSMAAPHVAGVAARFLQNHPEASPADVWTAISNASNTYPTTEGWPGIVDVGTDSPNRLLHWGSLNNGFNDGDPHITTVDGVRYDFQGAGEFVALRDRNGLQIQTRQKPVATASVPGPNPHTGLATCVSINTAVAARVGVHRVTYQPNISGVPDPSGLQLRVDGALKTLGAQGVDLGSGGRVIKSPVGNGIEIDFPDGTVLVVTPNWSNWMNTWYLNMSVLQTRASEGIMGAIAPGGWLPALPNGTSLGPKPEALHQRYVDLHGTFADAWRVTDATSLFDYAPGTSTETLTLKSWPMEGAPCAIPESTAVNPLGIPASTAAKPVDVPKSTAVKSLDPNTARKLCAGIADKNRNADCIFDVTVTGEPGFAQTYLLSERIQAGLTRTAVYSRINPTQLGKAVTFTARVARAASNGKGVPAGTVQFSLDGSKVGAPVKLDSKGRAVFKTSRLKVGDHKVAAHYAPAKGSVFLASSSFDRSHAIVAAAAR